jgi:hypothetical protein
MKSIRILRHAAVALAIGLGLCASAATAQAPKGDTGTLKAFEGVWKTNPARSHGGRGGPTVQQQQRADTFTWIYKADGKTLHWQIYHEYPQPKPSKVMTVIPDGEFRPCEMDESCLSRPGDPKEQSYAFWRMNDHMFVRIFRIKGVPTEYNLYAVSSDGKSFVTTIWDPETPEYQTVQVFDKQP